MQPFDKLRINRAAASGIRGGRDARTLGALRLAASRRGLRSHINPARRRCASQSIRSGFRGGCLLKSERGQAPFGACLVSFAHFNTQGIFLLVRACSIASRSIAPARSPSSCLFKPSGSSRGCGWPGLRVFRSSLASVSPVLKG